MKRSVETKINISTWFKRILPGPIQDTVSYNWNCRVCLYLRMEYLSISNHIDPFRYWIAQRTSEKPKPFFTYLDHLWLLAQSSAVVTVFNFLNCLLPKCSTVRNTISNKNLRIDLTTLGTVKGIVLFICIIKAVEMSQVYNSFSSRNQWNI